MENNENKNENVVDLNKKNEETQAQEENKNSEESKESSDSLFKGDEVVASSKGQFTLDFFGDEKQKQEEEEKEKKEEEEKKKKAKNTASQTKQKEHKVERDWTVTFGPESHSVYEFLPDVKEGEKVDMDKLREEMEQDYFALSKSRTRWDYSDAEKKIVHAVATGTAKGAVRCV